jgi:hypothetical protein
MEEGRTRSLVLADSRRRDRFLRITWHPDTTTVVFSHWNGPVCGASTSVELSEASRLVELLIGALRDAASRMGVPSESDGPDPTLLSALVSVADRARRYLRVGAARTRAEVLRLPVRGDEPDQTASHDV